MSIKEFYSFGSKLVSTTVQARPIGLKQFFPVDPDKSYLYDEYRLIQSDYADISFPIIFKQEYGNKLRDILDTGWPSLFLISDKMKAVLENNDLTGWKTFPVIVLDKQGQEINGYYGFSITGRCGKINYSKSEIIEKRLVSNGPFIKYYKGLHISLDKWDGTDFFIPEDTLHIIITDRVRQIIQKSKITNVTLQSLAEYETSEYALPKK